MTESKTPPALCEFRDLGFGVTLEPDTPNHVPDGPYGSLACKGRGEAGEKMAGEGRMKGACTLMGLKV